MHPGLSDDLSFKLGAAGATQLLCSEPGPRKRCGAYQHVSRRLTVEVPGADPETLLKQLAPVLRTQHFIVKQFAAGAISNLAMIMIMQNLENVVAPTNIFCWTSTCASNKRSRSRMYPRLEEAGQATERASARPGTPTWSRAGRKRRGQRMAGAVRATVGAAAGRLGGLGAAGRLGGLGAAHLMRSRWTVAGRP